MLTLPALQIALEMKKIKKTLSMLSKALGMNSDFVMIVFGTSVALEWL